MNVYMLLYSVVYQRLSYVHVWLLCRWRDSGRGPEHGELSSIGNAPITSLGIVIVGSGITISCVNVPQHHIRLLSGRSRYAGVWSWKSRMR